MCSLTTTLVTPRYLWPPAAAMKPRRPSRFLSLRLPAALTGPRGFTPKPPRKSNKKQKKRSPTTTKPEAGEEEEEEEEDDDDGTIPEAVTNRMMRRVGLSVGVPLGAGLLFFPLFYYLKVGAKVDVPTWIPFLLSLLFFGAALLGVSYGIVSASWDPLREGSLLGWNEARRNWPVFWQSLRGKK